MKNQFILLCIVVFAFFTLGCATEKAPVPTDVSKSKQLTDESTLDEDKKTREPSNQPAYNFQNIRR